jgi:hypothetical protein
LIGTEKAGKSILVPNNAEMLCMVHRKFVQDLCVRFAVKSKKVEIMPFSALFPSLFRFWASEKRADGLANDFG